MADQLLTTSVPARPHQFAQQRLDLVLSVLRRGHRNLQSKLARAVDQMESCKRPVPWTIQSNPDGYVSPSDLEAPVLMPACSLCHALPLTPSPPSLSIHKTITLRDSSHG